jgi:hypothetical protein
MAHRKTAGCDKSSPLFVATNVFRVPFEEVDLGRAAQLRFTSW